MEIVVGDPGASFNKFARRVRRKPKSPEVANDFGLPILTDVESLIRCILELWHMRCDAALVGLRC